MEWIQAHLTELSAACGAVLVIWQLFGKLDKALIDHLDNKFAGKDDFQRLETKVDTLVGAVFRDRTRGRQSDDSTPFEDRPSR